MVAVVSTLANISVSQGTLCGKSVELLRGTGCGTVVVWNDLISTEYLM